MTTDDDEEVIGRGVRLDQSFAGLNHSNFAAISNPSLLRGTQAWKHVIRRRVRDR